MGLEIGRTCLSERCGHTQSLHSNISARLNLSYFSDFLQAVLFVMFGSVCSWSQTASTGALTGEVLDPSGRAIVYASVEAKDPDIGIIRSAVSDDEGSFVVPLLPPGTYQLTATKADYSQAQPVSVQVLVTESIRVQIPMRIAGVLQKLEVSASVSQLQTDSVALGRVVDNRTIETLPLAARNFTQIVDLSPGILTGVNNAGELGPGGSGMAQIDPGTDGIFAHGSRSYDYFGSYQGTRQINGLASGQARISCTAIVVLPPFTNDRSAQALGAMFAGSSGAFGGVAVKADGSNINPVALKILNFKLPDGAYLIPTPQVVNPSLPFESQGFSSISTSCPFNEDQFLTNFNANLSQDSSIAVRFMWSDGTMKVTFPGNGLNGTGNISGFSSNIDNRFRVVSASWVRFVGRQRLNNFHFGYTNTLGSSSAQAPFSWSDFGVAAGTMNNENGHAEPWH